jgi:hypothetical protein
LTLCSNVTPREHQSLHLEAIRMQSPETEDRWYVDVGGTPKMMTLDELVASFESGVINSKTLVTEVGGSEWKPLKEVADLGEDEEEAPPSVQAPAVQAAASVAPVAAQARASVAPVAAQPSYAPPAARATLSAWPPVVASTRPAASMAPASVPPTNSPSIAPSGTSPSLAPVSTMPVVQDLNLSLDAEFKPRKSKAGYIAAAVVVLFVGGLFGVGRLTGGGEVSRPIPVPAAAPVALNTATSSPVTTPTPEPAAAPAPSTTTTPSTTDAPSGDKPSETASNSRLADDVKSKLKDADKTRADKKKLAKAAHGHAGAAHAKGSSSSGVFRNGGNANDPLNAKL